MASIQIQSRSTTGPIRIRPLREHEVIVKRVLGCDSIHDGWIYAPMQGVRQFGISGQVCKRPYSARVFGLPKTHTIEHANAVCDEHIDFLVWALSFFLATRLTTTERGYLDATPIKSGKLVDFLLVEDSLVRTVQLAEDFWMTNSGQRDRANLFAAAVHALFLGQYPQSLQFERFIYLYTAIDACFKLGKILRNLTKCIPHSCRIDWMCNQFGLNLPDWARSPVGGSVQVTKIRNHTLHEALFMDEPLGFAVHGEGTHVQPYS